MKWLALALLLPTAALAQGTETLTTTITIGPPGVTATPQWGCMYWKTFQGAKLGMCAAMQLSGQYIFQDISCDVGNDPRCLPPYQPNY